MKLHTFSVAMLTAFVSAHRHHGGHHHHEEEAPTFTSKPVSESILESFSLWNCWSCKMAFGALDRFIMSDKFDNLVLRGANKICGFKDFVPDDVDICPSMTSHYEQSLLTAVSKYLLGSQHMCNEVMGLCHKPVVRQIDLKTVVDGVLATKPASLANDNFIDNLYASIAG
mmetsp:Transcript_31434/g.36886  ORF Transcript_31434/g.36886 Transcript_31434/m.36886 type:complete len:170 (+) Transcript_31434:1-510(+)